MPTISMFYGIIVSMYYFDSAKHHIPHIHVRYSGNEAIFSIKDVILIEGYVPLKVENLVKAWINIHYDELMANWELAINGEKLYLIEPLR